MLSFLILKAFDENGADETEVPTKKDLLIKDSSELQQTPIDSRMKALNYLGSLLSQ